MLGWPPARIRDRLAAALLVASLLAFAAASGAILLFERVTLEGRARSVVEPYAELVAVGTETAVAFGDAARAQEILDTLRANVQILEARIVLADGKELARYGARPRAAPRAAQHQEGVVIAPDRQTAELVQALHDGARLHLVMDLAALQRQTRDALLMVAVGTVVLLAVVAVAVLAALQRSLVGPIAALAGAVDQVRTRGDYTHRVPVTGADEVARLGQGFNAMMETIGERDAELRQLSATQRTVLDNVGLGIISWTPDGLVTVFNRAAERMLGYAAHEVVGRLTPEAWHEPAEIARRAVALSAQLGETVEPGMEVFFALSRRNLPDEAEWSFIRKDGRRLPVQLTLTAQRGDHDQIVGFVGLAYDLTERKQAERAQRRHRDELEQTVQQRTAELRLARDAAEAANRAKSSFLANMSHEIRTPMNAILGMSHLALQSGLDPKQHNYIQKVHGAAESLLGILNDILDFSKIEAGKLDIESIAFSLDEVIDQLSNVVGIKSDEKNLELLLDLPAQLPAALVGDPSRLSQVLLNLCNNAIKFTDSGEVVVAVSVVAQEAASARLRFVVRDTGIGMTAAEQQRLFQPFTQADASTSRRYGGTGLGLAISRHLVQLMGGELAVDSNPGRGSRFSFELDFGLQAVGAAAADRSGADELRGLRALLIDDNAAARQVLGSMSEALGLRVDSAAGGEEALARVAQADTDGQPYQLLLLDWKMPGMDGVACIQALAARTSPRPPPPVVLMATAFGREEVRPRLAEHQLRVAALLTKPVTPSALLDACRTALGGTAPARPRHANALLDHRAALAGARVLLVEDNAINRELATDLLQRVGVVVSVANDGRAALDMLAREHFDGVLMDCQMPVMDGYAATRALREQPRFKTLPVIAMTANAMVGDRDAVLAAGMNDHIAKPIVVEEMFATMARWIKPNRGLNPRPAATRETVAPMPPRIDRASGVANSAGDERLYRRMLVMFRDREAGFVQRFQAACAAGDTAGAMRAAHDLKGLAATLGMRALEATAAALERACLDGACEADLEHFTHRVAKQLDAVLEELRDIMPVGTA